TNKRVEAVDVVGDVDICEVAVDRRGRVGDFRRRQTQIFRVRGEQVVQRIQLTSGCEVLLEVGDPVAVERVDRRRVQIILRHRSVRLNSAREGGVADEHEVQIGAGDAVFYELGHGDRLGSGALGVSEDRQRVLGAESAWVRGEFVLHGEGDVFGVGEIALLDQFGCRQYLQWRGTWVGPDHVADRRGGRAVVETQRVQIQILGGLRELGRWGRLEGSPP